MLAAVYTLVGDAKLMLGGTEISTISTAGSVIRSATLS